MNRCAKFKPQSQAHPELCSFCGYPQSEHTDEIPEVYLHVRDCRSGQEWIRPLRETSALNIVRQTKAWCKEEFSGKLFLDGAMMPRLDGAYYAKLLTDGRPPDSVVVWNSGGFYLTDQQYAFLR